MDPGRHDAACFHAADPKGFLIGWLGDEPIATISVVKYARTCAFLGFYRVAPKYRGQGYGRQIWNAGIDSLGQRSIGLDGVVAPPDGIPLLSLTQHAAELAALMLSESILPAKAAEDALHIAIAAVHKVDFLLSWNFKHIANPVIQAKIAAKLQAVGLALPFICPPEELLGEDDD